MPAAQRHELDARRRGPAVRLHAAGRRRSSSARTTTRRPARRPRARRATQSTHGYDAAGGRATGSRSPTARRRARLRRRGSTGRRRSRARRRRRRRRGDRVRVRRRAADRARRRRGSGGGRVHLRLRRRLLPDLDRSSSAARRRCNTALTRDKDGLLTGYGPFTITRDGAERRAQRDHRRRPDARARARRRSAARRAARSTRGGAAALPRRRSRATTTGRITRKTETVDGDAHTYDYPTTTTGSCARSSATARVIERYAYDANGNRTSAAARRGAGRGRDATTPRTG